VTPARCAEIMSELPALIMLDMPIAVQRRLIEFKEAWEAERDRANGLQLECELFAEHHEDGDSLGKLREEVARIAKRLTEDEAIGCRFCAMRREAARELLALAAKVGT
jgi:hypothetical protein